MGTSVATKIENERSRRSDTARTDKRLRIPWPENRQFRILSIDGGGIKGIFPARFLAGLEQSFTNGQSIAQYFDLVVGTSTGGLIVCALAAKRTAQDISSLYLERGRHVFPPKNSKLARYFFRARDERRLQELVTAITQGALICDSHIRFCIPSCEAKGRDVYIWKTPHHEDYVLDWKDPLSAAALATTAAPTFFRAFRFGAFEHLDGGLYANNPAMVGVMEALSAFSVSADQIRVLSVGCGDFGGPKLTLTKKVFGGLFAWYDVYRWFSHFQSIHVTGLVNLAIGPQNHIRIDPAMPGAEIALDDFEGAARELPRFADDAVKESGAKIAELFLRFPVDPFQPFYHRERPPTCS